MFQLKSTVIESYFLKLMLLSMLFLKEPQTKSYKDY